ncbi:MAG: hypothetical protein DHS20C17_19150 [Cyclobacteriaceae bacterium]|nr:MAG: hypothetical protein DHS20C17_19150 [Cyclobacteriaceae bacterium]
MEMAIIHKKKIPYPISPCLRGYLQEQERQKLLSVTYSDLMRYDSSFTLYDKYGKDSLWETVLFPESESHQVHTALKEVYSILKADGDVSVIEHLFVDRIDICIYGNTRPFRIRIVNRINDNFDYFYIKNADASRIYGLELEHILSPNRINYLVSSDTLVEEHIAGIPGDQFIEHYMQRSDVNEIRLAKEFVKFNERTFVRLLGDMHSNNFVIDITPDFEETHYRIRAIDFDQQSFEGRRVVYMPQYFKQNNPIIQLGIKLMTPETVRQYQREEQSLIANRINLSRYRLKDLIDCMTQVTLSKAQHIRRLKKEMSEYYHDPRFLECKNMGEIVKTSLRMLLEKDRQ